MPCIMRVHADQSQYAQKVVIRSVSQSCATCRFLNGSQFVSQKHISFINSFSKNIQFSQYGAFPGILLQISLSPTALKVIGPFPPSFSWRYQSFRSRSRLSCITELNSLFARSVLPATHTTQSRPSCITELNSLFARSVHRVLCTLSPSS